MSAVIRNLKFSAHDCCQTVAKIVKLKAKTLDCERTERSISYLQRKELWKSQN